jgi:hypothetical protein
MIDFEELKTQPIDEDITAFMKSTGGNHVRLLKAWDLNPDMRDDLGSVYQQLCHSTQSDRKELSRRIFGRYKVLRNNNEVESLNKTLGIVTDLLS